ncbi:MAG: peptide deformylase [Patescibacteria group bacterium]
MLKIIKYPDSILRKIAKPVLVFDAALEKLVEQMAEIMYRDDGIGLAAPQVNVSQSIVVIGNENGRGYKAYINPEITFSSKDKKLNEEGCLSLPEIFGWVRRPKKIHLKYQDIKGKIYKEKFSGLDAVILQHEIDHLSGILFIDRAEKISRGADILATLRNGGK